MPISFDLLRTDSCCPFAALVLAVVAADDEATAMLAHLTPTLAAARLRSRTLQG